MAEQQERTPGVRAVGFDHLVLRSPDVERSLRFYIDELGLEPERVDEWRRGEVLFPSVRIDATTLIGPEGFVKERLAELRESGVNCLNVALVGSDLKARVAQLDSLRNLIAKS